jgi:hypothetical protein
VVPNLLENGPIVKVGQALTEVFPVPALIFTRKGNPHSEQIIRELKTRSLGLACLVVGEAEEGQESLDEAVAQLFERNYSPRRAVALYDSAGVARCFSPTTRARESTHGMPAWAARVPWGVAIGKRAAMSGSRISSCANQIAADFVRRFEQQLRQDAFPWGPPKGGELVPQTVKLPDHTEARLKVLDQTGPNFAQAIANTEHALELPAGQRISWLRVAPDPIQGNAAILGKICEAFGRFERASRRLIEDDQTVQAKLLAGVDIHPSLYSCYLRPAAEEFSVRRPDLHLTKHGVFASEVDEMPGGFPDAYHLDMTYEVNQERWERCLQSLTGNGPLLFLVSNQWSECYIPEMEWFVETLRKQGYPVHLRTTDQLVDLEVRSNGVFLGGKRLGTIWRQFPLFETEGKLAEVVRAAQRGVVRLVPEFGPYGNKVLFSVFRERAGYYRRELSGEDFALLDQIMPDSRLVRSEGDFPLTVAGITVGSLEELRGLPVGLRDQLVLKVAGANTMAARSYGVLMGRGLTELRWREWIDDRLAEGQPFIVQRKLQTSVWNMPVYHTGHGDAEVFLCRVLLRPFFINGVLTTCTATAVPSYTERVHGMTGMCLVSADLGPLAS